MATKVNSGMKYFVFTWTVKNFSYWWQRSPDRIVSPTYIVNAIENTKWKLCTYKKNNDNEKISLLLNREEDNYSSDIVLDYELAILAADESTLVTGTKEDQTFKKGFGFGFSLSAIEINKLIEKQTKLPCHFKVRCRMWYGKGKLMEVGHCFALTRFQVEKFCFNWVIKDFSNLNYDDNVALLMKSDSDDPLMAFNLSLLKKEQSESEIIAIGIIAHRNVKHVNFESHIVDADGDKHLCGKEDFIFCGTGKVGSFELNRTKQTLMDIKNNYLKDNTLSLNCECTLSGGKMYETIEKNHFGVISTDSEIEVFKSKLVHPSSDLQDALMFMYDDAILSDVELRTSTKTFRVHKNILSARSPVFSAMFQADMKENAMKYVDITDLDDETLDKMIMYIYNDTLVVHQWEKVSQLYQAANKYQILILKQLCSEFLASWICETNACEILFLADMHEDEELKKCAQTYILSQKEMMLSDKWIKFMNDNLKLAAEIMYLKCTEK